MTTKTLIDATHDALCVLVLTDHVRSYLAANDPNALAQARAALGLTGNSEGGAEAIRQDAIALRLQKRRQPKEPTWYVGQVVRANAGGTLWNAVDAAGREYVCEPSHDQGAVRAMVDRLNRIDT